MAGAEEDKWWWDHGWHKKGKSEGRVSMSLTISKDYITPQDRRNESRISRADIRSRHSHDRISNPDSFRWHGSRCINGHQYNPTEHSHKGQLETKLENPWITQRIHSTFVHEFCICHKVEFVYPRRKSKLFVCQGSRNAIHPASQIVGPWKFASKPTKEHHCHQKDGSIQPQSVAQHRSIIVGLIGFQCRHGRVSFCRVGDRTVVL